MTYHRKSRDFDKTFEIKFVSDWFSQCISGFMQQPDMHTHIAKPLRLYSQVLLISVVHT